MTTSDVTAVETPAVEWIARVCHEANRAYCAALGDDSQVAWSEAPDWQRESAIEGVCDLLLGRTGSLEDQHNRWMAHKHAAGWVYGPVKDALRKTHPLLVPWGALSVAVRRKDALFRAVVTALTGDPG